ncbi:hypothetical protein D9M70_632880 [compost metagenome]
MVYFRSVEKCVTDSTGTLMRFFRYHAERCSRLLMLVVLKKGPRRAQRLACSVTARRCSAPRRVVLR